VAVKIKLMRLGKIRQPYYRIVVADARTRRGGKAIETIGKYHPKDEPSVIEVDSDRAQYWLGVGAQPTEPVENILKITGDWQRFKGLPGSEGTLRRAEPKPDKADLFAKALAEAGGAPGAEATTPRKKSARKGDGGTPKGQPEAAQPETAQPEVAQPKGAESEAAEQPAAVEPTAGGTDAAELADVAELSGAGEKAGDGQG
jgi:small subunit ribosomal protein S16